MISQMLTADVNIVDIVDSKLIMGKGRIYTFLTEKYELTMEVCYDDGNNQIAMYTKKNESWLYLDLDLKLQSFDFLINGKKLKKDELKAHYKKIKVKDSDDKEARLQSSILAAVFKTDIGEAMNFKMIVFLNNELREVVLKREPFGFWEMKIENLKTKKGSEN